MANLLRSPKSGNDWNLNDLDAYHIELKRQDPLTFFGLSALPDPQLDEVGAELFQTVEAEHMVDHRNAELIHLLDLSILHRAGESAVADFAVELFKRLGYVRRHRVARTRKDMQFLICGEYRRIKADVCIVDRSSWGEIELLVQEDKRREDGEGSCPQAELIAAFCENNTNREVAGLADLANTVIPGIILTGSLPTFFKIPITKDLITHVRHGTYPHRSTVVTFCHPPPARAKTSEGMKPLENRQQILGCYEAFKDVVGFDLDS